MGEAFEELLASVRSGTIAVNTRTGFGFLTAAASWADFLGHTIDDVQSGIGVVHNALLIDRTERSVVRGPFRTDSAIAVTGQLSISPKTPWFASNRTAATTAPWLVNLVGKPSLTKLPAIFASALRG